MCTRTILQSIRATGLSQTEISRRTGIPQPRLSRWEGGAVPDAADDALKLVSLAQDLHVVVTLTKKRTAKRRKVATK